MKDPILGSVLRPYRLQRLITMPSHPFLLSALVILSSPLLSAAVPAEAYVVDSRRAAHAKLKPLPFDAVRWTDGFWAERFHQLKKTTLDVSWRLLADPSKGHVLDNFRAAAAGKGTYAGTNWQDEWLYKWLEAASCVWRVTRDASLKQRIDGAIPLIAAAQQSDGYISTNITARQLPRFTEPRLHEVYNMGHLITAGVIHRRMTGETALFDLARKSADFLCRTLGVQIDPSFAHNPSAIMGLIELYRDTGEKKYLDCAATIVDSRGTKPKKQTLFTMVPGISGTDVIQDRVPVRDSNEVVGHNVFFTYLYTGSSDLYSETGDQRLDAALSRLWADLTGRKMFIHGGVSAQPMGISNYAPVIEAAGAAYDLPNGTCYNETCGQVGMLMWGYRRLIERPDAEYADVIEREMFNGFLGAQSLDGERWFYRNVIRRYDEDYQATGINDLAMRRQPGRNHICCPSNVLRTLAELSSYFYSQDAGGLWVHQFGGTRVDLRTADGARLAFEQRTDYPRGGEVKFIFSEAPDKPYAVRLRLPGWADRQRVRVNGRPLDEFRIENGYVTVSQAWRRGDTLVLSLPMESRLMAANPNVEATRNQTAVMRGPVVYCVESPDLPEGVKVPDVHVARTATFSPVVGLAGGDGRLAGQVVSLSGPGLAVQETGWSSLYRPLAGAKFEPISLKLIPYFAWGNRGKSAMSVWMPLATEP